MNPIDKFLNNITMYRLVLYGLIVLSGLGIGLSAFHLLGYPLLSMLGSLAFLIVFGYITHKVFVHIFEAAPSTESWIITVLILFLIMKPADNPGEYGILGLVTLISMASKYVLTYYRRHIFNPIAIALVLFGLLGGSQIFWWVGSAYMLPAAAIIGYLVVRKIRRYDIVVPFLVVTMITYAIQTGISSETPHNLWLMITSGPLVFFATIMLTEPQTSPHTRKLRMIFGAIVGVLFSLSFSFPPLYSSAELALIVGNVFSFAVSSKRRIRLVFQEYVMTGDDIYEFSFLPDKDLQFVPGQYMEWTLPHKHTDSRGDRRFFTIASSPGERDIKLVVRIDPEHSSSYKRALLSLRENDSIWVSLLSGDFVLPKDDGKPLVFFAGGIGITPVRAMVRDMVDSDEKRDMTLYYFSHSSTGFSYWQMFNRAVYNGLKPYYVITGDGVPEGWTGKSGRLTSEMIKEEIPDYKNAHYYLSGPDAMVVSYKKALRKAGIARNQIMTDYFPGF